MQLTRLAAAALLALAPCAAFAVTQADFAAKTTENLANLCGADPKEPMGDAALNFCHGFAQGVVSVEQARAAAERVKLFCFPTPPPSRTDTLKEFVTWARANPGNLSQPAANGLVGFLRARYACDKP